jgi:hypothetical protein
VYPFLPFGPFAVEAAEHSEGPGSSEGSNERNDFIRAPGCQVGPFAGVFCNLFEISFTTTVFDFNDVTSAISDVGPLSGEICSVHPSGIHQNVQVKVPTFTLVGAFHRVESAFPVRAKLTLSESREPFFELNYVPFAQVWHITDG